jgi:RHS repeat-associated protein
VETDYDALGRVSRVTLPYSGTAGQTNSTVAGTTTTYDPFYRPLTIQDGGGGQTTYNYGQANDILVTRSPAPAGEHAKVRQFEYDALQRLTSACEVTVGTTAWPGGNCAQTTPQTGYWTKYAYDADGHLTNDGVNALTYDAEDRIVSTSGTLGSATYAHRLTGHRVMKTSAGSTTAYIYSQNRLIAEYVNGALSKEYIYLGHRLIAEYSGGTLYYHHGDHLSDRVITDATGNKVGEQAHYPFGETWYSNNTTTKFHLTSYERDSETGNDYARHRFHVNRLGRFSSVDPLQGCGANPQGLNHFTYVGNDPINRTDPTGLCWNIWLPCCTSWWGCGMDDEGDTVNDATGPCDPTIDASCGQEPPRPDPDCVLTPRPNAFNIVLCAPPEKFKLTLGLGGPVTGSTPPHDSKINSVTATAVEDWFRANPGSASPVLPNESVSWATWFNVVKSVKGGTVGHVTWDVNYTCKGNPYDVTFTLAQIRCAQPSK